MGFMIIQYNEMFQPYVFDRGTIAVRCHFTNMEILIYRIQ